MRGAHTHQPAPRAPGGAPDGVEACGGRRVPGACGARRGDGNDIRLPRDSPGSTRNRHKRCGSLTVAVACGLREPVPHRFRTGRRRLTSRARARARRIIPARARELLSGVAVEVLNHLGEHPGGEGGSASRAPGPILPASAGTEPRPAARALRSKGRNHQYRGAAETGGRPSHDSQRTRQPPDCARKDRHGDRHHASAP